MVTPPKRATWIPELLAEKMVCQITHCDWKEAREPLEAAIREGQIRSRKVNQVGETTDLQPEYWETESRSMQARNAWERFEVHQGDLLRWLSPAEDRPASRQGRPPKHDWDGFWIQAVLLANKPDGLPETQTEFEQLMAEWFENETGGSPSVSQIRERAGRLYKQQVKK